MKISELPEEVRVKAFKYFSKGTNDLGEAFDWNKTEEGANYWLEWHIKNTGDIKNLIENVILKEEPKHYDNSKGSLYKFCDEHELNSYEFDIIKRVMRCRKKGLFLEDLEKTKFAIDLYIKEQQEKYK